MEFFDEIVVATKQAQDETIQLEKDAGVLFKHLERKIKGIIRSRANLGYTDVIVDIGNINVDLMSKWSIKDLMTKVIVDSYIPVSQRLFGFNLTTPFSKFAITEVVPMETYHLDWSHGLRELTPPAYDPPTVPPPAPKKEVTPKKEYEIPPYSSDIHIPSEEEVQKFLVDLMPFLNMNKVV